MRRVKRAPHICVSSRLCYIIDICPEKIHGPGAMYGVITRGQSSGDALTCTMVGENNFSKRILTTILDMTTESFINNEHKR